MSQTRGVEVDEIEISNCNFEGNEVVSEVLVLAIAGPGSSGWSQGLIGCQRISIGHPINKPSRLWLSG